MIEREEPLYIPTDDEILAVDRWEKLHARMKGMGSLSDQRDSATYSFEPTRLAGEEAPPNFRFTAGWARSVMGRAERSLQRSITDSGLNNIEWQKDWDDLVNNRLPNPGKIIGNGICSEGHGMLRRSKYHWICPCCNEVKWNSPIT